MKKLIYFSLFFLFIVPVLFVYSFDSEQIDFEELLFHKASSILAHNDDLGLQVEQIEKIP